MASDCALDNPAEGGVGQQTLTAGCQRDALIEKRKSKSPVTAGLTGCRDGKKSKTFRLF